MGTEPDGQLRKELEAAWARDGISYPPIRMADAMADYADLRRFLGIVAAAMPHPLSDPAGNDPGDGA